MKGYNIGILLLLLAQACVIEKDSTLDLEEIVLSHPFKNFDDLSQKSAPKNKVCRPQKSRKLTRADCEKGFICVPDRFHEQIGICLKDCGMKSGNLLKKNPNLCENNLRCMRKKNEYMITIGMFCLMPQEQRDELCDAPFDEEACLNGFACLPIASEKKPASICKEECSIEHPCSDPHDRCIFPIYSRLEPQGRDLENKKNILCDLDMCEKKLPGCACDEARDFKCYTLFNGSNVGKCLRKIGICEKR